VAKFANKLKTPFIFNNFYSRKSYWLCDCWCLWIRAS